MSFVLNRMDFVEICGRNRLLDADFVGCGQPIVLVSELYRCTHCDVPFHKKCILKHFESDNVITQEIVDEQERRWDERAENEHFVDYAEFSWIDRSEEYLRKDEHW